MKSLFVVFSMAAASLLQLHAQPSPTDFVGCVSQIPNDGLRLGVGTSGVAYRIDGNKTLRLDVNKLVRVRGELTAASGGNPGLPILRMYSADVIADSCASVLPSENPQAVVGKVGEGQVAIPLTTTASANEVTPGFQTETITDQEPPVSRRALAGPQKQRNSPIAPTNTAQDAQSANAAESYAQAAARSEIQPGNTLGTNASFGSSGIERPSATTKAAVVKLQDGQRQAFSPNTITIRAGETVEWRNLSNKVHEIIANPAKISRPSKTPESALPMNTTPFDSGFLEPGATFSYSFTAPGVYRYFCSLNCSRNSVAQVTVER